MSSLAAARADNFYYSPAYDPKHGSLNKFRKSHPLGHRARKLHEGILVIRFEMPYKVVCLKCDTITAKGVRFNAQKKCIGNYFSTKIYEFTMKCYHCDNIYGIKTDPEKAQYVITKGLRLKVETFSPEDAGTVEFLSAEERQRIEDDPMMKLEHQRTDELKFVSSKSRLEQLIELQSERGGDDYALNSQLRHAFREKKAQMEAIAESDTSMVPLVSPTVEDIEESKRVLFPSQSTRIQLQKRHLEVACSRILDPPAPQYPPKKPAPAIEETLIIQPEQFLKDVKSSKTQLILPERRIILRKAIPETPTDRSKRLTQEMIRLRLIRRCSAKVKRSD